MPLSQCETPLRSRLRPPPRVPPPSRNTRTRPRGVCVREGTPTTRMRKRDAATATLYISVTRTCAPELIREPKTRTCKEFELKFQTLPVSLSANVPLVVCIYYCLAASCLLLPACCFLLAAGLYSLPRLTPPVHDVRPFSYNRHVPCRAI